MKGKIPRKDFDRVRKLKFTIFVVFGNHVFMQLLDASPSKLDNPLLSLAFNNTMGSQCIALAFIACLVAHGQYLQH